MARNDAARAELTIPFFILDFVAGRRCEIPDGARIRHITVDGLARILAMGRKREESSRPDFAMLGMCEPYIEVAEHLVRGFSDVEIALLIGRPIGMVHAFIVHIHRQLGVSTRSELIGFVRRARESNPPLPPDRSGVTMHARGLVSEISGLSPQRIGRMR